jgi:NAD(P)-dependent dehydrogenase (short-subunit alcohol dehydrogenase family)
VPDATQNGGLAGHVALVTGGVRGIGLGISERLVGAGVRVAAGYSRPSDASETFLARHGAAGATIHQGNIGRNEDCERVVREVIDQHGRLDILVNNAGIMERGLFADVPVATYTRMFATNVTGTMLCTRAALPAMIERRYGRIVNVSSQLARAGVGTGGFAAYAATKGAIEAFTRAVAHEVGEYGITVNAIAPGGIDTDMSRDVMTPEYRARRTKELPVRHLGALDDVAYAALCLADDAAGYLTGQVLQVNGGWVMS